MTRGVIFCLDGDQIGHYILPISSAHPAPQKPGRPQLQRTILTATALALTAAPALALDCASIEVMHERMEAEYGETIVSAGYSNENGRIFEVWASGPDGSWTFLETDIDRGISCIVQWGDGFTLNDALLGNPA